MKISRTVEYAVLVATTLAQSESGRPLSYAKLIELGGLPERFAFEILQRLEAHQIIHQLRGVISGFILARNPEAISFLDLIDAADDAFSIEFSGPSILPGKARAKLDEALQCETAVMRTQLDRITLLQLL